MPVIHFHVLKALIFLCICRSCMEWLVISQEERCQHITTQTTLNFVKLKALSECLTFFSQTTCSQISFIRECSVSWVWSQEAPRQPRWLHQRHSLILSTGSKREDKHVCYSDKDESPLLQEDINPLTPCCLLLLSHDKCTNLAECKGLTADWIEVIEFFSPLDWTDCLLYSNICMYHEDFSQSYTLTGLGHR